MTTSCPLIFREETTRSVYAVAAVVDCCMVVAQADARFTLAGKTMKRETREALRPLLSSAQGDMQGSLKQFSSEMGDRVGRLFSSRRKSPSSLTRDKD